MAKGFASTTDLAEKKVTFSEIGTDLYAFTAEGDPNSAVIVGQDGCLVFDAQATPAMANKVIERVRAVTDKPIKYVVLSHYHAVRVLGASAYKAQAIVAYRKANGGFRSMEQLALVKGVGLKTIEKNRDRIVLGSAAPARKAGMPALRAPARH